MFFVCAENMKRFYYFIKNYQYDFLAALSAVTVIVLNRFYSKDGMMLPLVAIFFSILVIIYVRSRDRDFYYIPMTSRKNKDDWIGKGNLEYIKSEKCFSITAADPGYIYSNCLNWSDYRFSFQFKIRNKCIGSIIRAVNLSNYVMLQISLSGINPHLRINGEWKVWKHEKVELSFKKNLEPDRWYKCLIVPEKNSANIKLFDNKNKMFFDREWIIPGGKISFGIKKDESADSPIEIKIPFFINLDYGSMGFRNCGGEKALIKNVLVEKI